VSDGLFATLLIGGLIGLIAIVASVAFLVHEIRCAPLIEDYRDARDAMNTAADDLGIDDAHLLTFDTARVDDIDKWIPIWAEQQRKEGR
jgi:hypothetical protein